MAEVSFRKATDADCEFAYSVKKAAYRDYVEKLWGWDEAEQRRIHEERFRRYEFRIIVAGGRDVGYTVVARRPDCLEVVQLFLLPAHQGAGIGAQCVTLHAAEAKEAGLPVRLRVLNTNPRALAFYRRQGFSKTGETDTHILMQKNA